MNVNIIHTYTYTGGSGFAICRHFMRDLNVLTPATAIMPYCNTSNKKDHALALDYQHSTFYTDLDLKVYRILFDYMHFICPEDDQILMT